MNEDPEEMKDREPSEFSCPDCHGVLWEGKEEGGSEFRCRIGHEYSAEELLDAQVRDAQASLSASLRSVEERQALARRLISRTDRGGSGAHRYRRLLEDAAREAGLLRSLLAEYGHPRRSDE